MDRVKLYALERSGMQIREIEKANYKITRPQIVKLDKGTPRYKNTKKKRYEELVYLTILGVFER